MLSTQKNIKHFVVVRFFPYQDARFSRDIFDLSFVSQQVLLAKKNFLKSLENQSNKNFEIVFLANEKYFACKEYDFIFTELKNCTSIPVSFAKANGKSYSKCELTDRIKAAYDEYDFVIQSRMDLDDFIFRDAVEDTQSKIQECDSILSYGYCKGYMYFEGELYPYSPPFYNGYNAILQSIILKSSFAKKIPFLSIYNFNHTKVKLKMEDFLTRSGNEFSESMFQRNVSLNAYVHFKYDANYSNDGNPYTEIPKHIKGAKKLTGKDITKKQLEEEFGFHYELKSIR